MPPPTGQINIPFKAEDKIECLMQCGFFLDRDWNKISLYSIQIPTPFEFSAATVEDCVILGTAAS